jgi:hypothetical protein
MSFNWAEYLSLAEALCGIPVSGPVAGREAQRLKLRDGAAPFRSLGHVSVVPPPYQFVPLIMALRLDPVRLLLALWLWSALAQSPFIHSSGVTCIRDLGHELSAEGIL